MSAVGSLALCITAVLICGLWTSPTLDFRKGDEDHSTRQRNVDEITAVHEKTMAALRVALSRKANLTVSKDGDGDFSTNSAAAPEFGDEFFRIDIEPGFYRDNVHIGPWKTNLVFVGKGAACTVISSDRSVGGGWKTDETPALSVHGDGFLAVDLGVVNTADAGRGYAVALRNRANDAAVYRCRIYGQNGTINADEQRQYYGNCDIYGAPNVVFRKAPSFFRECTFHVKMPMRARRSVRFDVEESD